MNLNIPQDQRKRQALSSLAGYAHQILAALDGWMRVRGDGILLIEVAEDYAVLARDAVEMTQVKRVDPTSEISLGRKDARDAIISLWQFAEANPTVDVRLQFLTTAQVGNERDGNFENTAKGIDLWHRAAVGSDVEELRAFLLKQDWPDDLAGFLRSASPDDLRARLFSRLRWTAGAEQSSELIASFEARLRARAVARNLAPSDGAEALPALVFHMLATVLDGRSHLTEADFEQVWDAATSISVSRGMLRQLIAGQASGPPPVGLQDNFADIAAPRLARREALVAAHAKLLREGKALWLHGSSGLGKTRLAQLIAARSNGHWHAIRMRGLSPIEARDAVIAASAALDRDDLAGFVLDDLPVPLVEPLLPAVQALARSAALAGAKLVITAERGPTAPARLALEPFTIQAQPAPYLNDDDVGEMVSAAGGDPEKWAKVLHLTCGGGHPLFVDARIAGLASRGWPANEQLSGLLGDRPGEVEEVRADVALRLLGELDADSHQLLLRLSMITGRFDRALALALAEAHRPLARPGALLDLLVGPWIEVVGRDSYKLSPLVTQAGSGGLSDQEEGAIRKAVIDTLTGRSPIAAHFLSEILLQAMILRDPKGFEFISAVVMTTDRRMAAQECFALGFMTSGPDGRLVPENASVSTRLRLAQVLVAAVTEAHPRLEKILSEAEAEFATTPPIVAAATEYSMLIGLLGSEELTAPPRVWMPRLIRYTELVGSGDVPAELIRPIEATDVNGLAIDEFFFAIRAGKIRDINDLSDLFQCLEAVDPALRRAWFGSTTRLLGGPPLYIQGAWSNAALDEKLDAASACATYRSLTEKAEEWGETDVAVECYRSQAVLLDEYLKDGTGALAVLDHADTQFPGNARLQRSRATVLANIGMHAEAKAVLDAIESEYSVDEPLERTLMLQASAISAAKSGDRESAARLFLQAYAASEGVELNRGIRVGLLCDAAIQLEAMENRDEALHHLAHALVLAANLDPEDDREWFAIAACTFVARWIHDRSLGLPVNPLEEHAGSCSLLKPNVKKAGEPANGNLDYGYHYAARLEARLGVDHDIRPAFEKLIAAGRATPLTITDYRREQLAAAAKANDLEAYVVALRQTMAAWTTVQANQAAGLPDKPQVVSDRPVADWDAGEILIARGMASGLIATHLLEGDDKAAQTAEAMLTKIPALGSLLPASGSNLVRGDDTVIDGLNAIGWLRRTPHPDPDTLLAASFRIACWIPTQPDRSLVSQLWELVASRWTSLARDRRMELDLPALAVPAIEKAVDGKSGNTADWVNLILAAAVGCRVRLSEDAKNVLDALSRAARRN